MTTFNKDTYTQEVRRLTEQQVKSSNKSKIPGIENLGKTGYEVDHIVSINDCYDNNGSKDTCVNVNIASSWVNLRVVRPGVNESKGSKSLASIQKLMEAYNSSKHVLLG